MIDMARVTRFLWLKNNLLSLIILLFNCYVAETEIRVRGRFDGCLGHVLICLRVAAALKPCQEAFLIFRRRKCKFIDAFDFEKARCAYIFRQQVIFEYLKRGTKNCIRMYAREFKGIKMLLNLLRHGSERREKLVPSFSSFFDA